jgi:hypothetical protein
VAAAVLAAALLLPAGALGSRAEVLGSGSDRVLSVEGGLLQRNDIVVTRFLSDPGHPFLVTEARDGGSLVNPGLGCASGSGISPSEAPAAMFAEVFDLVFFSRMHQFEPDLPGADITSRSKSVGCFSNGADLSDVDAIRRVVIDLKDRDDSARVGDGIVAGGQISGPNLGGPPAEILAGKGDDAIVATLGFATLDGEQGDDRFFSRQRLQDTVKCGPGNDRAEIDLVDAVSSDCETVERVAVDEALPAAIAAGSARITSSGRLRLRLACPAAARRGCRGVLRLRAASGRRRGLGATRYRLAPGQSSFVSVRLRGRQPRLVRALAIERDSQDREKTFSAVIRLRTTG